MQWLTSEFRSSSAPPQGLPWDARLPGSLEISKAKQLLTLKLFGSAQQGNILPAPAEAEQGDVLCPEGLNSTFPPLYSQLSSHRTWLLAIWAYGPKQQDVFSMA